ncbi:MAG: T9SS type A sorting domain-containing protein [Bacteroidota bacterium]
MRQKIYALFLLILLNNLISPPLHAQCIYNDNNVVCDNAPPLNCLPASFSLPEFFTDISEIPGCPTPFAFHNTSWFTIEITSSTILLSITPSNCQYGLGIQVGLYNGCDFSAIPLYVQCQCVLSPVLIGVSGIPPGTYYLFVDGCSGDICDVDVELLTGSIDPITTVLETPARPRRVSNPSTTVCPGDLVSFTTDQIYGAEDYSWDFPPGVIPILLDCNGASVIWGDQSGPVTVTAESACIGQATTSPPLFITVGSTTSTTTGSYCFPEESGFFYAPTDSFYTAGVYDINLLASNGCDSIVTLIVEEESSLLNTIDVTLCPGEEIEINGVFYNSPIDTLITLPDASSSGCDSSISLIVTIASDIEVSATTLDAQCGACVGQIDLSVSGGIPPYTFLWSNNSITEDLSGLCAGTYSVTIVDGNNCTSTQSYTIDDSANSVLELSAVLNQPTCPGNCNGSLMLNIACGNPPFQIDWESGLPDNTTDLNNLCAGSYSVTVTDATGLNNTATFDLPDPNPILANPSSTDVSCFGGNDGSIVLNPSSGAAPYNYSWNDLAMGNFASRSGLAAGTYVVTVTDFDDCSITTTVTINEPTMLAIALEINNLTCSEKGSAAATVSGGTAPYSYQWSTGSTASDIDQLEFGSYGLTVTDANGCTLSQDFEIIDECCELVISLETIDVPCGAGSVGQISINIDVEGTPPYTVEWSDPDLRDTLTLTVLPPGVYAMTITDASGCMISEEAEVLAECCPEEFTLDITDESCTGINDGSIAVNIDNPATPPYTFEWSDPNLPNESTLSNLSPGAYALTLTNGDGCSKIETFDIASSLDLEVTTTFADCDGKGGSATASADGFFLSFFWSNGGSGSSQSDLAVGDYSVTVYNLFGGCRSAADFTIEEDPACPDGLVMAPHVVAAKPDAPGLSMQLSPNPASEQGRIEYALEAAARVTISLFDGQGRLLRQLEQEVARSAGAHQLNIDLADLNAGIYFVQLQTDTGQRQLEKWIKSD